MSKNKIKGMLPKLTGIIIAGHHFQHKLKQDSSEVRKMPHSNFQDHLIIVKTRRISLFIIKPIKLNRLLRA